MEDRMDCIETRLSDMDKKIDRLLYLCETDIRENCNKMGKHISFIESVYDQVKYPMTYICSLISRYQIHNQSTNTREYVGDYMKETINL